jgi:hypothetical protein
MQLHGIKGEWVILDSRVGYTLCEPTIPMQLHEIEPTPKEKGFFPKCAINPQQTIPHATSLD